MNDTTTTHAASTANPVQPAAAVGQGLQALLDMQSLAVETSNQLWLAQQQSWRLALESQARLIAGFAAADTSALIASWLDLSVQFKDTQGLLQRCAQLITDSQQHAVELLSRQASHDAPGWLKAAGPLGRPFAERRSAAVVINFADRRRSIAGSPTSAATVSRRRAA